LRWRDVEMTLRLHIHLLEERLGELKEARRG
jgi:hypothetical protein